MALGAGSIPLLSSAQSHWPQKTIHIIVPWPAGGGTDLTIRVLAEEASALLQQPIVILNRPGAAGSFVTPLLKAAEPDGYTIGQLPLPVLRHALMKHVPWDPLTDLSPILQVSGTTFGLLVPSNSPWQTVQDLLDWAHAHPTELLLGSTGVGSTPHLAMEELLGSRQITYTHVPFKGTTDHMLALANGSIMASMNSTGFIPWVEHGKLRLLAVFSQSRNPRWPHVPTMRELGFTNAVYHSPWGLVAPRGTPEQVISTLHDAFKRAMFSPRHLLELDRFDQKTDYLNTADYQSMLVKSSQHERALLKRMGLLAKPRSQ